jgi:hypothetical protein
MTIFGWVGGGDILINVLNVFDFRCLHIYNDFLFMCVIIVPITKEV